MTSSTPTNKKLKSSSHNESLSSHQIHRSQPPPDQQQSSIEESIQTQLKNRMLVSGEWIRLQKLLLARLKGSKWEQDLRCEAENRALQPDKPNLSSLIEHLRPIAQNSIPSDLRDELTKSIHAFVESNLAQDDHDVP
ncbi:hypothetical protein O181_029685 [Austropuccinia psidii MF-1]|uniref:Transcription and mRNA export factor SUS1 n=1 Tax=Austropuccinia psidii MF-1 TaxID=1389203 RepID=A0A9Q3H5F6_9BASI|nr:hypothetical protein [Austropuccinia psidii MF-1]